MGSLTGITGPISGAITWNVSDVSAVNLTTSQFGNGSVAVRNSRDPEGPALIYTRDEIVAFIEGVKDGDFDGLLPAG